MKKIEFGFPKKIVTCIFNGTFDVELFEVEKQNTVIITDNHVYALHKDKMEDIPVILIEAGEQFKVQSTADNIIAGLIARETDKQVCIIGIGGGVVTDIAGYVASVYKRGVRLCLVPTSILAMVDAAIGGKNGINVGDYKNMVGTVYQPEYILYDYSFLESLPKDEWINGFAEIIKHACIYDALLFDELEQRKIGNYISDKKLISKLVERNVNIKMEIVCCDELEQGKRKSLNFGHTIGHAVEKLHGIPHGHAVSIGIVAACLLSEKINGLNVADRERVVKLLARYGLPVGIKTDHEQIFQLIKLDKKRRGESLDFIVLNKIGNSDIQSVKIDYLNKNMKYILS